MSVVLQNQHVKELLMGLENNHVFPHKHSYDLYRDWLEAVWAFLNIPAEPEAYKKTLDRYTREQGEELGRLFSLYAQAAEELRFQDILGELFMQLDLKSVRAGQFFTPWHIAEMMARMQFGPKPFQETVERQGYVSVMDPAVGSGVMLLAFAKVVHDALGWDGLAKLRLYGTDIDERCILMCRIQLRMNCLDSVGRLAALVGALRDPTSHNPPPPASSRSSTKPSRTTPVVVSAKPVREKQATLVQMELF